MQRIVTNPRDNWQKTLESIGFDYHTPEVKYWNETAYYQFTTKQIDQIEAATNELDEMCLEVVQNVIDKDLFAKIGIPEIARQKIIDSWNTDEMNLYGRFDFGYDGKNLKLYEYNADTPTSLFEAAIIQWQWLQDKFPKSDQFNSLQERLIDGWNTLGLKYSTPIHFAFMTNSDEDKANSSYLAETAKLAGFNIKTIDIRDVGEHAGQFYDLQNEPIYTMFKLYPWEMMWRDEFASSILTSDTQFIEPAWKLILSNKALMPMLWDLAPNHPNLLKASFNPAEIDGEIVRKPFFSREGANIAFGNNAIDNTFVATSETPGNYGDNYIYQESFTSKSFQDNNQEVTPVLGAWVVAGESAGMGIREDTGVTSNLSRFVPHKFD